MGVTTQYSFISVRAGAMYTRVSNLSYMCNAVPAGIVVARLVAGIVASVLYGVRGGSRRPDMPEERRL